MGDQLRFASLSREVTGGVRRSAATGSRTKAAGTTGQRRQSLIRPEKHCRSLTQCSAASGENCLQMPAGVACSVALERPSSRSVERFTGRCIAFGRPNCIRRHVRNGVFGVNSAVSAQQTRSVAANSADKSTMSAKRRRNRIHGVPPDTRRRWLTQKTAISRTE